MSTGDGFALENSSAVTNTDAMTVHTLQELAAAGFSRPALQRAVSNEDLVRLRRGLCTDARSPDVFGDHRQRMVAARLAMRTDDWWFSHGSAALLHGLPVAHQDLSLVHITRDRATGASTSKDLRRWAAEVPEPDRAVVDGLPVTSVSRTLLDLAHTSPDVWAVAALDEALRLHLVGMDGLQRALDGSQRRVGNTAARQLLLLADGASESVGESISRVNMALAGIPAPELQRTFRLPNGHLVRVDFYWEEFGLVVEFDGAVKYVDGRHVLLAEKAREDALRRLGLTVVRWGWDMALRRPVLAALLRGAMEDSSSILASHTAS